MRNYATSCWPCIKKNNARWRKFWRRDSNDSQFIHFLGKAGALRNDRGTALGAATSGQEQVSRDFHQTVALGAGQSVHVEHKFGSVTLHGESGREVKISATIRAQASSHEEAESFAQKIKIEVQQTGEGVRIKTIYPDEEKSWFHTSKHSSWSVS